MTQAALLKMLYACALICWHFLSRLSGGSKLALPVMH
jgi:hypothetical protein